MTLNECVDLTDWIINYSMSLEMFGLKDEFESIENLRIIEPIGYLDFINLMTHANYVLTDLTLAMPVPLFNLRSS